VTLPKLSYDWLRIVKRAWSIRFNALAFVFGAAEVILPIYVDAIPRNLFALLSLAAVIGSTWARVTRQKGFY
jgi:hypothetical protein